jgi:hypothetical protein
MLGIVYGVPLRRVSRHAGTDVTEIRFLIIAGSLCYVEACLHIMLNHTHVSTTPLHPCVSLAADPRKPPP